jgi:hypothetical protein
MQRLLAKVYLADGKVTRIWLPGVRAKKQIDQSAWTSCGAMYCAATKEVRGEVGLSFLGIGFIVLGGV